MYPYQENACFWLILTVFLVRVHCFYYFSDFKIVKNVHPYQENACFWLILTVFLVRVHFFYYFSDFNSKKRVPLPGKCMFLTHFDCFPRVHFFYYFSDFNSKKSVPLPGKCMFLTNFDCFPRKGTLFLLFFRFQNSKKKCTPTRKMHVFDSFWLFSS